MRRATLLILFLALTPFADVTAQQWTSRLCFSAKPLPRCRSFLVTEAHVRYRLSGPEPGVYPTAELGWMVNGRGKHSYGFSVFGGQDITWETTRAGLKGRYRRYYLHGAMVNQC